MGAPVPAEAVAVRAPTVHATAVVIGAAGVLLLGPSGAGKTRLALALVERARARRLHAAFVADDRVILSAAGGRLVARRPLALAGLAELRGHGIVPVASLPAAVVRLAAELVPPSAVERLPEETAATLAGVAIPCVRVPRQTDAAAALVEARLPFCPASSYVG